MIVVDASIAVKWLIEEPESDRAAVFLEQHTGRLVAPDLLLIEVTGTLVRLGNSNKAFASTALEAVEEWTSSWSDGIVRSERVTERQIREAARIALQLGHPLKDCIYLALALELGAELATCDARFRDRAATAFPHVRLLADYAG